MKWTRRLASLILFGFAVLQINDPDPLLWFFLYFLGALSLVLAERKHRLSHPLGLAILAISLGGAIYLAFRFPSQQESLGAWWEIEVQREAAGLLLQAILLLLAINPLKARI